MNKEEKRKQLMDIMSGLQKAGITCSCCLSPFGLKKLAENVNRIMEKDVLTKKYVKRIELNCELFDPDNLVETWFSMLD